MATHSSILAWRIPWTGGPGGLQSMEWQRGVHGQQLTHALYSQNRRHSIEKSIFLKLSQIKCNDKSLGEGNGNPLQYSWPGKSHGQRSLVGYSPRGCKELDTTEQLTHVHANKQFSISIKKSAINKYSMATSYHVSSSLLPIFWFLNQTHIFQGFVMAALHFQVPISLETLTARGTIRNHSSV